MRGVQADSEQVDSDALCRASEAAGKRCRSTLIKTQTLSTCSHMLNRLLSVGIITDLTSFLHAKAATASARSHTQSQSCSRAHSLADWSGGNC